MTHMLGKSKPYNLYREVAIPFFSQNLLEVVAVEDQENMDKLQSAADAQAEMLRGVVRFFFVIYIYSYIQLYTAYFVMTAKVCIIMFFHFLCAYIPSQSHFLYKFRGVEVFR